MSPPLQENLSATEWASFWFESDQAMNAALNSPEMGAAVDDAKRFLDMERTGMIIVDEKTVIG